MGERPRLAFESDLLGPCPRHHRLNSRDETLELADADVRRRAAAKVDELERPAGDRRLLRQHLDLGSQRVEIGADLLRILVRVDAEVAELAPLAAERDVEIEAERRAWARRRVERREDVG